MVGTDLAVIDPATGSLTRPLTASLNAKGETCLSDEQFALVVAFAHMPVPASPLATDHELDQLIGTMAATLKAPRTSLDQGRLKLAVYRRVLQHVPIAILKRVAEQAVRSLEWFPTPSELLKMAEGGETPEARAHQRARWMVQERRQRLFDETLSRIERREISHEELQQLDKQTASVAETRALIITKLNGDRVYRTRENVQADIAERAAGMSGSRAHEQVSTEENDDGRDDCNGDHGGGGAGDAGAPDRVGGARDYGAEQRAAGGAECGASDDDCDAPARARGG